MTDEREFSDWEKLYQDQAVETMPWYSPHLDPDFKQALIELAISSGRVLDMGAGPGTQAIELAKMGYSVTATDISATAVELAAAKAAALGLEIDWRQDDVLNTRLAGDFDCVFDRGLFHVLPIDQRDLYARTIHGLLVSDGYLLLKCFSDKETSPGGPHRLSPADIEAVFSSRFGIQTIRASGFAGTALPVRKALFCAMRKG